MKLDLNFYTSYKLSNMHLSMKSRSIYLVTALVIVTVAIIGTITLVLVAMNITNEFTINELTNKKNANSIKVQEYKKANAEMDMLSEKEKSIANVSFVIQSNRMVTKKELTEIYSVLCEDVSVEKATYSNSILTLDCICVSKDSPSLSAEKLNEQGIPTKVLYGGFTSEEQENQISFSISCLLGEGERHD
ncbi:hypothetical protein RBG61_08795 [Paludicola sp. MB14-C6]|uniref:hypothetical protein n=1 Tax=Paludihabitans sp. MB14-C6 TaxID=3070656 RepID=UPI0027DE5EF9|nr:hypothetical protein [Paludicola sp. MB14-C6]WMJ22097.1 hypothetical protein RBG61_08795 [Paludicola sp. MB14-C6]